MVPDSSCLKELNEALFLSITKTSGENFRSSSVAVSESGKNYFAGKVESDTHLLDFPSEQVALMMSVQQKDYGVSRVITLVESKTERENKVSPLVIKILIDHSIRTGKDMGYKVIDNIGNEIFSTKNVRDLIPFYRPDAVLLKRVSEAEVSPNFISTTYEETAVPSVLKTHAILGLGRDFPRAETGSSYGTSILTGNGKVFFSGQYSGFEKRLGIHSEMSAFLSAVMHGEKNIVALGLVSTKYENTPCEMCGCCRQFLAEMIEKFSLQKMKFYCFAKTADNYKTYSIGELLPNQWSSKKW